MVGKDIGPFGEKKSFWKIFPQSLQTRGCVQRGPPQLLALPFGQHRRQIFFPKSFFYPRAKRSEGNNHGANAANSLCVETPSESPSRNVMFVSQSVSLS